MKTASNPHYVKEFGRLFPATLLLSGALLANNVSAQSSVWTNTAGGSWTNTANWTNSLIATGSGSTADFSQLTLGASPTVTLDTARTIGNLIFGDQGSNYGWALNTGAGGALTLAASSGTPTITVDTGAQATTIGAVITGTAGFTKAGAGTLTLTGAETYSGTTTINAGVLTISGTSSDASTSASSLYVGGTTGNGVLNFNTSGAWSWAVTAGNFYIGGEGNTTDTGSGALNQTAGTINFDSGYVTLGAVGSNTYGSYVLGGGTLNIEATQGARVAYGGLGSWVQTGGILDCPRYFSVGGGPSTGGTGVASFLGGTANIGTGGYRLLIPDVAGGTAVVNVGTEAGGTASVLHTSAQGIALENSLGSGTLNLNSGILRVDAGISRYVTTGGSAILNFDGGTLQAGTTPVTLMSNTLSSVNIYNGGAIFDSQSEVATVSASLLATSGSGIYPVGGILNITNGGGSGYIGAPLVTVGGGSGFGAMAIGNVSGGVLTSVTITCPGQNYLAGDTLVITFVGGGAKTPATTFDYTLKAGDVSFNTLGGVTKLGTGTLNLTAPSSYVGTTTVSAGTLDVTVDSGLGSGNVVVSNGATLTLGGGNTNGYISTVASLILGTTAIANLNYSGVDSIVGLSLNGGATYVTPGTWGAAGSGAPNTSTLFTGTGTILVTAATNGTPVKVASYTAAQNVYAGNSAVFSVSLGLGTSPSYQWQYTDGATFTNNLANGATGRGSYIFGAPTSSLTVSNVSSGDTAYYYTCLVSNALPSLTNSPAASLTLLVSTNQLITRPGDTVSDFYNSIGTADPYPSGHPASEIIDGTLVPYLNYGAYPVGNSFLGPVGFVVTPGVGSSVVTAARIYTSTNSTADDPADFSLYGSEDGVNWTFIAYTPISLPIARNASGGTINSNNEVLREIDFPNTNGYYSYAVYFTNTVNYGVNGLEFAEAQLIGVLTNIAPGIVTQPSPSSQLRLAGGSASFSLVARGAGPLTYQWYEGSTNNMINGATNASYTAASLTTNMNGDNFFCVVSNPHGSISSSSVTLTVTAPTPGQQLILSYNPVSYWPLNETSGTIAYDYAGNNDGTYIGGCSLGQGGLPSTNGFGNSGSVYFDGTTGYVDVPENNLNITGPITLIAYVQTTFAGDVFETPLGHGNSSYRLDIDPAAYGGNGGAHFADAGPDIVGLNAVNDGNWHQLVGVYDGTTGYLYVDGVLTASAAQTTPSGSTDDVWIGGASDPQYGLTRNLNGYICQVAILSNALTAAEVQALFDSAAPASVGSITHPGTGVPGDSQGYPTIFSGGSVTLTATGLEGTTPLSLQWYYIDNSANSNNILGATNASYTVSNAPDTMSGYQFGINVMNSYGTNFASVTLQVEDSGPVIYPGGDLSPLNGEAYVGAPVTYTVFAQGNQPLSYVWTVDGVVVSGATNSSFTAPAQCGLHTNQVTVSNSYNGGSTITSSMAVLLGDASPTNITFTNVGGAGWTVNGSDASISTNVVDGVLELTDGGTDEASSAFYNTAQYVGSFNATFTYTVGGNKGADGAAFIIQNSGGGVDALGVHGGALGYSTSITNSAALEIDLYNAVGIALGTNGETYDDGGGSLYGPTGSVLVNSGDPIEVQVTWANSNFAVKLTDITTSATYSTNYTIASSMTSILGGADLAYVGFSGGTGSVTSIQTITNFSFSSTIPSVALATSPVAAGQFTISWPEYPADYDLEVTTNLANGWSAGPTPILVGGTNQVTVSVGSGEKFYRLKRAVCVP